MTTTAQPAEELLSSTVATRVRELMAGRRLTQGDISRVLGVSRSGISDRLTGVKPINLNELPVLAGLFGVSIEYLLGLTDVRDGVSISDTRRNREYLGAFDLTAFRARRHPRLLEEISTATGPAAVLPFRSARAS